MKIQQEKKHIKYLVAVTLTLASTVAFAAPPATLSRLGCGPNEVARVNGSNTWVCSTSLSAAESSIATLDGDVSTAQSAADTAAAEAAAAIGTATSAQSVANSAQASASSAASDAAAAQGAADSAQAAANSAQSTANSAASEASAALGEASTALAAAGAAQAAADNALSQATANQNSIQSNLELRIQTLENGDFDNRLDQLESLNIVSFSDTVIVSSEGDAITNGNNLLSAISTINPTAQQPVLIIIEPGVFNIGSSRLDIPSYTKVSGAGPEVTIIEQSSSSFAGAVGLSGYGEVSNLGVRGTDTSSGGVILGGSGNNIVRNVKVHAGNDRAVLSASASQGSAKNLVYDTTLVADQNRIIVLWSISGSSIVELNRVRSIVPSENVGGNIMQGAKVTIKNSDLQNGFSTFHASSANVSDTSIDGFPVISANDQSTLKISRSSLNSGQVRSEENGVFKIAMSELDYQFAPATSGAGTISCLNVYGSDFSLYDDSCLAQP
ncbi:hypothetical protein [Marinobacterium jannaschii]|uniref:hypothetical protein n=1 Tax=Marinobacterium jannaschii TaxID=64970 RepID=UPI00056C6631|nr:hypothetical protein [Marinobacterium jannaschii]